MDGRRNLRPQDMSRVEFEYKIAVIIPFFNEVRHAESCLKTVVGYLKKLPVSAILIAVNDGSVDGTDLVLAERQKKDPAMVRIVTHAKNRGYGAALSSGVKEAKRQKCEFCLFMDSDLTNHPRNIADFMRAAGPQVDYIKASRYIGGGGMKGVPINRQMISRAGNLFCGLAFGGALHDYTNGFRMARTSLLTKIPRRENGFPIILEEMYHAYRLGARCREIPIILTSRKRGDASKFRYTPSLFWSYAKYALMAARFRLGGSAL